MHGRKLSAVSAQNRTHDVSENVTGNAVEYIIFELSSVSFEVGWRVYGAGGSCVAEIKSNSNLHIIQEHTSNTHMDFGGPSFSVEFSVRTRKYESEMNWFNFRHDWKTFMKYAVNGQDVLYRKYSNLDLTAATAAPPPPVATCDFSFLCKLKYFNSYRMQGIAYIRVLSTRCACTPRFANVNKKRRKSSPITDINVRICAHCGSCLWIWFFAVGMFASALLLGLMSIVECQHRRPQISGRIPVCALREYWET